MDRTSSDLVLSDPGLVARILEAVLRYTTDGLLVWRRVECNPKRLMAWPSDLIRSPEDFELRIGRRLAGVTVGYPADAEETDDELWLRIIDGAGNRHYIEHRDAPDELRRLMKEVHRSAAERCGQGRITTMRLYG